MLSNELSPESREVITKILSKCKKCYGTGRIGYDKDNRPILCRCAIRVAQSLKK